MKKKQPRKEKLRQRAETRAYRNSHLDNATLWEDGYRAALKDVRRAAGKGGIPSKLVKLLAPIR